MQASSNSSHDVCSFGVYFCVLLLRGTLFLCQTGEEQIDKQELHAHQSKANNLRWRKTGRKQTNTMNNGQRNPKSCSSFALRLYFELLLTVLPSKCRLPVLKLHPARKFGPLFLHARPGVMAWYSDRVMQRKKAVCDKGALGSAHFLRAACAPKMEMKCAPNGTPQHGTNK